MAIELGDIETWPEAVRDLLEKNSDTLRSYEDERRRIDKLLTSDDIHWRLDPPRNPHCDDRSEIIAEIDRIIGASALVAWHCTRLLDAELTQLPKVGLLCHSRDLFMQRMETAVLGGALSREQADELIAGSQVEDFGRNDRLWWVTERELLQISGDVGDLLRNWGGEAIYNNAGRSRGGSPTLLSTIGKPAIVEAHIPISMFTDLWISVGERITNRYVENGGIQTAHGWGFDGMLRADLPPDFIVRVYVLGDPMFDALTNHKEWAAPLDR